MSQRRVLFAAAAIVATSLTPAVADDAASRVGTQEVAGSCGYVGVTTLTGQIQYTFGGEARARSTDPTTIQPIGTRAICTLISPAQGLPGELPTISQTTETRMSGAVAVTPLAQTSPWPLRPVRICVSGDAQYGPVPAERTLGMACTTSSITPDGTGGGGGAGAGTPFAGWVCAGTDDTTVCV